MESVKEDEVEPDTVYPAHVAPTIHFPVEIKQPLIEPEDWTTRRYLVPEGALVEVEAGAEVVVVVVPLGSHLIPVL